jgi:drug/metabolite transporter (DMT)-like permease
VLGVIYTLLGAATFGLNNATVRRGVLTSTVTQVVATSMPIGVVLFLIAAALSGQLGRIDEFSTKSVLLLASAGVVHFVFGRYCGYRAIQAMGANLASPVTQSSLMVTLTLAIIFLHERLDLLKIIGICLMIIGPYLVARRQTRRVRAAAGKAESEGAPRKFKPRLAEGYFFGVLCCFGWGSSPILVRAALDGTALPLAGGVISYSAATLAVLLILLFPVARRDASGIARKDMAVLTWIGVTVCVSQIFMYLAMAIAPVTVVQPLGRFGTIFGVFFAWFINREHEVFDRGVLAAIGISVLGGIALALDPSWVMQWLDAPPEVAKAFGWSWPAR